MVLASQVAMYGLTGNMSTKTLGAAAPQQDGRRRPGQHHDLRLALHPGRAARESTSKPVYRIPIREHFLTPRGSAAARIRRDTSP